MGYGRRRGLSPRMRGNRWATCQSLRGFGSIPAHAGEPRYRCRWTCPYRVYPRACGGTVSAPDVDTPMRGLSPRMRGNQVQSSGEGASLGSIPAHAGEPRRTAPGCTESRVYPRACGGTWRGEERQDLRVGLSPRMRGNLPGRPRAARTSGSIPAHAGEPLSEQRSYAQARVYPRACGGTELSADIAKPTTGLSPRMRGNRPQAIRGRLGIGSIPAHAGEPSDCVAQKLGHGVYPRACGGTFEKPATMAFTSGLSPRMRGNHGHWQIPLRKPGSIPAHAGEPYSSCDQTWMPGVYPRACGGTSVGHDWHSFR